MASAASAVPNPTPCIVFDSRKAGLISIVEEELPTEEVSPSELPKWRKVDYFGDSKTWDVKNDGVKSAFGPGCPLAPTSGCSSPKASPSLASPKITMTGWGLVPPRHASPLGFDSSYSPAKLWTQAPQTLCQLSSVIPDISDDEASRHGSIAGLEIYLRKPSIIQTQVEKCNGSKADIEVLVNEESDVLGPLHSPLTPLTPSIRTSASPRASSECLGRASSDEDQSANNATRPKLLHLSPSSVFKNSFSFGQGSKSRKESGTTPDPMSMEGGIQRPSSARSIAAKFFWYYNVHTGQEGLTASEWIPHTIHRIKAQSFSKELIITIISRFLPMQELEPAYQEALADVAEDPDFVEVEIKPKTGSITRRASLFANIFTNKDVDVDPDLKFKPSASEVEIKQGIADAQKARSQRKMVYSRNVTIVSLATINAVCIALSFGLFSVWYATAPLILVAPLLKSTMVLNLFINDAYEKAKLLLSPPEEDSIPIMDYATAVSFSNEGFEDIQSTLDSLVDQKDVDMHKNLLLISCNDNVWHSDDAKSTTRIILENILTNIIDEAKFQMPRDGPDAGFDNMWCRRGIYKGVPYVLMIKEGTPNRKESLDLIRSLLHAYNLRKESYYNPVPSAFFTWCEEWAELHDFASFDFLVNVNSETSLDEHCISHLYQQMLKNPACAGVSSRVEVDSRSSRWSVTNLFSNSQLMVGQVRQSHQTQIMHKASVSPSACQMLRICEETCGPHVLKEIKKHRPSPMDNMVTQICSFTEEDDMMYGAPQVTTLQAIHAVTYARPSTTLSEFLLQRQQFALSTGVTNLAILCDNQMHWFERLSSAVDLLAWCLPACSLAIAINFLRSAALQQHIPVLIVLSAIVALPWTYAVASALWLARSWEGRLRYLLGFCILAFTGPIVAVIVFVSTVFGLHRLRPEQPKRRRSSAITVQIQRSDV
ncbi:glycosyltransferase family 2 protein, partial [Aureobasidium melanogenum]